MAPEKSIGIRQTLTSALPRARLEQMARESWVLRRRRKVDSMAMLWALTLGFGTGDARALEAAPGL